jgi:hypothetical protein
MRDNRVLQELCLRGRPLPAPVVRALYFLLAAGGLPSLTRLEYCVKGSDAAAARASARVVAAGAARGGALYVDEVVV